MMEIDLSQQEEVVIIRGEEVVFVGGGPMIQEYSNG